MAKNEWLKPKDIAKRGLIITNTGNHWTTTYNHVLDEITAGRLRARDYGKNPDKPYYLVSTKEIERYNHELEMETLREV